MLVGKLKANTPIRLVLAMANVSPGEKHVAEEAAAAMCFTQQRLTAVRNSLSGTVLHSVSWGHFAVLGGGCLQNAQLQKKDGTRRRALWNAHGRTACVGRARL